MSNFDLSNTCCDRSWAARSLNEIKGKGVVKKWPAVVQICAQQPLQLSEEGLRNGVVIFGSPFRISGLVHRHEDGDWSVSVKRPGSHDWQTLARNSDPMMHTDLATLPSRVVLVQLSRCNQDDATKIPG